MASLFIDTMAEGADGRPMENETGVKSTGGQIISHL